MNALRLARVLLVVAALGALITSVLVALVQSPSSVGPALDSFGQGIAGNPTALGTTANALTPILLVSVAACVAFRAGFFDVGQVGQVLFGGVAAGAVAPKVPGPGIVVIVVVLVVAAAAGAVWSLAVSSLSRWTGLELVVLSLVANYLADALARLTTRTVFQDPAAYGVIATRTVPRRAWLPRLWPGTNFHLGLLIALVVFVAAWFVLRQTVFGHRLTMFGRNPVAARLSGVDAARFRLQTLGVTGAVCGIAGAVQVLGVFHRYQDGSLGGSNSVAWTGLTAAILVPAGIAALLPVGALLAALTTGFNGVQIDIGISTGLSALLQGVVVLAAALAVRGERGERRRRRVADPDGLAGAP